MDVLMEPIETLCGLRIRADVRTDGKQGAVRLHEEVLVGTDRRRRIR